MKEHDATEIAYNNGYEAGKLDALKWIPFKQRLPEKDGYYLVVTDKGNLSVLHFTTQYKLFNTFRYCGSWNAIPVTHWMQLPKKPEENDNEV